MIDFSRLYLCSAHERIARIRRGVPARELMAVASAMGIHADALIDSLNFPRAEVERRARNDENLPLDQSERMLGIEYLIGQVASMVDESGNPENFDAAAWMGAWLFSPLPALGYETAASFLDTAEGQRVVSNLLAMAQSGAYA
ncbi:MAG: antitoxin Xre/MbcA/ParS toxin-binding domain-containing protein [Massilia sp.]